MSEGFIVSARKYRPQRFDEVVGQELTTLTLKNAIQSEHIAHSFLFTGPRGVGKTTIARILAKTINCKDLQSDGEACNQCDSCVSFNNNSNFNIYELDAASKNSVDDIRGLVEQVNYPPQNAKYKIFIIDEVHMLSQSAFNAFLKTLEEPPSYAKFILATTEKHKILPTILSRCQIYDFKRITVPDIQLHLKKIADKESVTVEDKALHVIAQKADGGLRDALSMFDRLVSINSNSLRYEDVLLNLNVLDYEYYFKFVDAIHGERSDDMLLLLEDVLNKGFDLDSFLNGFSEHIRNLWVAKKEKTLALLEYTADIKQKFVAQAALFEESLLLNLLQLISDCEAGLRNARNKRLLAELTLLKMCYVKKVMNTSWAALDEEKKKPNIVIPTVETKVTPTPIHRTESQEVIENKPTFASKKGLEIHDLVKKVESTAPTIESKEIIYSPIVDSDTIWDRIISNFKGNKSDLDLLIAFKPTLTEDTFVFYVQNKLQNDLISSLLRDLSDIYTNLTHKNAHWKCIIDETRAEIVTIETKAEVFDKLAQKFPILNQLKVEFGLDLYND